MYKQNIRFILHSVKTVAWPLCYLINNKHLWESMWGCGHWSVVSIWSGRSLDEYVTGDGLSEPAMCRGPYAAGREGSPKSAGEGNCDYSCQNPRHVAANVPLISSPSATDPLSGDHGKNLINSTTSSNENLRGIIIWCDTNPA